MLRRSGQVEAPYYSAPPSRHGFGGKLIFLSVAIAASGVQRR